MWTKFALDLLGLLAAFGVYALWADLQLRLTAPAPRRELPAITDRSLVITNESRFLEAT